MVVSQSLKLVSEAGRLRALQRVVGDVISMVVRAAATRAEAVVV